MKAAMLGTWHVHTEDYTKQLLKNEKAELAAVWEDSPEQGEAYAQKHGVKYCPDLDALLADPEIQGVVVCTATSEHRRVMLQAAAAGKAIFTEKVLAFTGKEAEEIRRAVKQAGVPFTISYPHLTNPAVQFAKQVLESGELGRITYARVRNVHDGASSDWLPPHFYDKKACGGGAMMDLGAHPMYTLHWLLGEPCSILSLFTSVTGKPVEDNAVSVIEFANGAIGVSETGFVSKGNPYTLEISGTEGALMVHGGEVGCTATGGQWKQAEALPPAGEMPLDRWVEAVVSGTPAPEEFGIDEAVALTKLMEGAYASYESGKKYRFE